MVTFSKAIVRKPCKNIVYGLNENNLETPNYEITLRQHDQYIDALQKCGLEVIVLEESNDFPDSVFIEDNAVCTQNFALITRPGAKERKNEKDLTEPEIKKHFSKIEYIKKPGTLDGGDVMMVDKTYYIGISARTNNEGADQFISILNKYKMSGIKVNLDTMLHLKTGLSYLENNNLLISGEFLQNPIFNLFHKIEVDKNEAYAANSLWINDKVIVPSGFPETRKKIEAFGYETLSVDTSEFRKLDGGLSCLSLRF